MMRIKLWLRVKIRVTGNATSAAGSCQEEVQSGLGGMINLKSLGLNTMNGPDIYVTAVLTIEKKAGSS